MEESVKSDLLSRLKGIDPYFFEKVVLMLLKKMGYGDFFETSKSGDGGIDGVINQDKLGLDKIYRLYVIYSGFSNQALPDGNRS
jgi:restriction system protein